MSVQVDEVELDEALREEERWRAVQERDATFDGAFVYAVRTTGIFCRPSCASRKPARENVRFFPLPEMARQAGYRSCKRCEPHLARAVDPQVEVARLICRYIEARHDEEITLRTLSEQFNFSPSRLQRLFKEVTGISPQAYIDKCRLDTVRGALQEGLPIADAIYEVGWGSPSRLYSRSDAALGMTPQSYQQKGAGMVIHYTVVRTPLGALLVAATERGICSVNLGDTEGEAEQALHVEFARARVQRDDVALGPWVEMIVRHLEGEMPHLDLPLDVRATAFQQRVWQALQQIPYGETRTYSEIAEAIGQPDATRAVARACATNPTALLVPCHRVLRKGGALGGYRWGVERKQQLLEKERGGAGDSHN
jgi:AraC family transcriptional regulator, regulatory protein of adaptative response / methylated-DNA-[protein]-cysteine methyltransferase